MPRAFPSDNSVDVATAKAHGRLLSSYFPLLHIHIRIVDHMIDRVDTLNREVTCTLTSCSVAFAACDYGERLSSMESQAAKAYVC